MARTRRSRGGAFLDYLNPRNWGKSSEQIEAAKAAAKKEKCDSKKADLDAKKADYDKECGPGEASAADVAEVPPAPVAAAEDEKPAQTAGRSRRRRHVTRRKSKGRRRA
jgi:hypothetical protein